MKETIERIIMAPVGAGILIGLVIGLIFGMVAGGLLVMWIGGPEMFIIPARCMSCWAGT